MKNKEQFSIALWDRLKKEGIPHTFETRSGNEVTQITIMEGLKYPVLGFDNSDETLINFNLDGSYTNQEDMRDLFIVWDEEQLFAEGFLNIYPNNVHEFHKSKVLADKNAAKGRIACIPFKLTYKKGEGL